MAEPAPRTLASAAQRLLFVYGTLRREGGAHDKLAGLASFFDEATMGAQLFDLGRYPAVVVTGKAGRRVVGELYRLHAPAHALAELDRYEGIGGPGKAEDGEYMRELLPVFARRRGRTLAWVYLYARPTEGLALIPGGDYVRYLRDKTARDSHRARRMIDDPSVSSRPRDRRD